LHRLRDRSHHLLVSVGFLVFSAGLGRALGFPPLFLSFVAGMVLVNLGGHRSLTWEIAASSERPFYFILLLLVGAGWHLGHPWALLLAPLFFLARVAAKSLCVWMAGRLILGRRALDWRSGLAISGQGATSVALVASVQLMEQGTLADSAMSMILISTLLSAALAPRITAMGLQREAQR